MKFSQVPTNATPAVGDFVIGVSSGGVDQKSTIAQLAAVISANLGSNVLKLIGATNNTQAGAVIPGGVYTTYATVAGSSSGGKVVIKGNAAIKDGNSGSTRTGHVRIQCDGVTVGSSDIIWQTISNGTYLPAVFTMVDHTPSAGAHTWTLQVEADTASASTLFACQLEVIQALP